MRELFELLRRNWLFFALVTVAALALRLLFVFRFPHLSGDTFIYGDIAKNWLNHHFYGVSDGPIVRPTLIRLPGYPAFLGGVFSIFGQEHYTAVMVLQALIDTNTCLVIAALALELMNERAAKAAYLLAAVCPLTANYAAAPLTETLAIFCTAHAFYYGVRGMKALRVESSGRWLWCLTGVWTAFAILLRPDDGLLIPALLLGLLGLLISRTNRRQIVAAGLVFVLISLAPLVPWTVRNWRTFHLLQPLAPRYANDPGEFVPKGFNRWVKTWLVDYASTEEIYWHVSGEKVDLDDVPERAFDSRLEYDRTSDLVDRYNDELYIDGDLDWQFEQLGRERIAHNPFRYYVWLPMLRIGDMWLRPRTEMLPLETRWWEFSNHPGETAFAVAWAAINLFYLAAALRGWFRWRLGVYALPLLGYVVMRSLFLGTLENPEPRYVLECFPVILALAGGTFSRPPARTAFSMQ